MTGQSSTSTAPITQLIETAALAIRRRDWPLATEAPLPGSMSFEYARTVLESAGVPALLDVAEAAQRVYFVFGEGNGPLESLIHRNDLGELGAALQKLPQVEAK